jgi:elongation factor P
MKAIDLRPGTGIRVDGKVSVVTVTEHRTPGNLRAFVQLTYKEIASGKSLSRRFNPADDLEVIDLDRRQMEYLYSDASGATFMDVETFDQHILPRDLLGSGAAYLTPNTTVVVLTSDGNPVSVELPSAVELVVTETPPGIKGATATNQMKEATCETGLRTRVPPFIEVGEKIRVSTSDGSYLSRAKDN